MATLPTIMVTPDVRRARRAWRVPPAIRGPRRRAQAAPPPGPRPSQLRRLPTRAAPAVDAGTLAARVAGQELRQRRTRAGLTQVQLAALAGLPRSTVAALERGHRHGPRAAAARTRLAQMLGRLAPAAASGVATAATALSGQP